MRAMTENQCRCFGRGSALLIILAVAVVLASTGRRSIAELAHPQESGRQLLTEHPLFRLGPVSSHADSMRAIRYDRFVSEGPVFGTPSPAYLALIRILEISAPDSAAILAASDIRDHYTSMLLDQASTVTYEVLDVLGCRGRDAPTGRRSTLTRGSTSWTGIAASSGGLVQMLFPGAEAYVIVEQRQFWGGLELLVNLLCLGEPNEDYLAGLSDPALEGPLFGLRDKVAPLFAEFGRALSASDPDAAAAQGESSIPSGQ